MKNKGLIRKRVVFYGLCFLAGMLLGFFTPFSAGFVNGINLRQEQVQNLLQGVSLFGFVLAFLLGTYLFLQARKYEKAYNAVDMDEDEQVEELYKGLYRHMEFAVIALNIATICALYQLVSGFEVLFQTSSEGVDFHFSIPAFLCLLILLALQSQLFRLIGRVRQYKLSIFSTVAEIRDYVNSYDEGERQASMEQSFITLFNLNQKVLPLLYMIVCLLSIVSQTQQLVAYVVLAIIHIYINLSQYHMVKKYFR